MLHGRPWAISSGVERLPYKEEVAGSNPASPTLERVDLQVNLIESRKSREECPAL